MPKSVLAKNGNGKSTNANDSAVQTSRQVRSAISLGEIGNELLLAVARRELQVLRRPDSSVLPFPMEILPTELQRLVAQGSKALPCPPDYIAVPMLVVTGAFIGTRRPVEVKPGWQEFPVIYAGVVGPTGSRKSPAMELALTPATRRDAKLHDEYLNAKREYLKSVEPGMDVTAPVPRQFTTTDTTIEALADVLCNNPSGILVDRDELTGWVASLNQYKGGKGSDRQFWLSAWSCQDYIVNRKGKEPVRVTRPFASVVGCIPPDMLGELGDRRGREDGFLDRILFAFPEPVTVKWTDAGIDEELLDRYSKICEDIANLPNATAKFSPQAQMEYRAWYDRHKRDTGGPPGPMAKLDGYCARLANIIHHLRFACNDTDHRDVIDQRSVEAAVKLADYFRASAIRAFGHIGANQTRDKLSRVLSFILNSKDHTVRARDLQVARIADDSDDAKLLLENLAELGFGTIEKPRKDSFVFRAHRNLEAVRNNLNGNQAEDRP